MLAGDPHLGNQLPSHWYLIELSYDGESVSGASHPGVPYVLFGKTKHMSWAVTSSLTDLSDLYLEKISDDGKKYSVDGEWKDLKIIKEYIHIKGQDKPIEFEIK